MKSWRPKKAPIEGVKLTPEEGFVLSRVDGKLSTDDIVALTGIEKGRVEEILGKLRGHGMLEEAPEASPAPAGERKIAQPPEDGYSNPWLGEVLPAMGSDLDVNEPSIPTVDAPRVLPIDGRADGAGAEEEPMVLGPEHEVHSEPPAAPTDAEIPPDLPTSPELDDLYTLGTAADATGQLPAARSSKDVLMDDAPPVLGPEHEVADEEPPVLGPEDEVHDEAEATSGGTKRMSSRPPADLEEAERNYRKIYESEFRHLERDARVEKATHVQGPHLLALCLDPDPQVIAAIFKNMSAGLEHARRVARYHKTPQGLEFVVKRAEFVRDTQVSRMLVRNEMMNESLMRRVLNNRRMADVYKTALDRDLPERNRGYTRGILRQKFSQAPSEERADLVVSTEGRCLTLLVGQTFDARTTAILCGRTYTSVLFIQNLARFPACPPPLLGHLLKQPFVKRSPPLRKMLLQHPNMPSELKRLF
jgi:hypothetical protein